MYAIQVDSGQLHSRGQQIRQLLQPLTKWPGGPAWKPKILPRKYIIGTHDGSPSKSDYHSWSFATFVPNFRGAYYEIWIELDDGAWHLDRAYLTIYRINQGMPTEMQEFLALHCDPREPDDTAHAIYKQGPHLHIQDAADPIPHAHIALNRGHLEEVLSCVESLSEAIGLAVLMLKEEILVATMEDPYAA
jgi:hypothetical protein